MTNHLEQYFQHKWTISNVIIIVSFFARLNHITYDSDTYTWAELDEYVGVQMYTHVPLHEVVEVGVQTQLAFARGLSDGLPKFVKAEGYVV